MERVKDNERDWTDVGRSCETKYEEIGVYCEIKEDNKTKWGIMIQKVRD